MNNIINITFEDSLTWLERMSEEMESDNEELIKTRLLIFEIALGDMYGDSILKISNSNVNVRSNIYKRILDKFILHLGLIDTTFPMIANLVDEVYRVINS